MNTKTLGGLRLSLLLTALAALPSAGPAQDLTGSDFEETRAPQERPSCRGARCAQGRGKAAALIADGYRELRAGRPEEAVGPLERATQLDPDSAEAFFRLGDARHDLALRRGTDDKLDAAEARAAIVAFEKAAALDPKLTTLAEPFSFYAALEECRQAVGDNENALKANMRSIAVSRGNFMPRLQRAALHFTRQEWSLSSVALYRGVQAARKVKMYNQLSRLVRQAPRFAVILELPQNKIILDTYDALQEGDISEGEAEEQIRDYVDFSVAADEEDEATEQVAVVEPRQELIAAADSDNGEMRDSLNDPSLERRAPSPEPPAGTARTHLKSGDEAYAAGRLREAVLSYETALSLDLMRHEIPLHEEALIFERVGSAYRRLGKFKESLGALKKALDSPNKRASAYYELSLYCAQTMDLDRSLSFLEKAIRTAPTGAERTKLARDARRNDELAPLRKGRAAHFSGLMRLAARGT
ncbi:MAG: tetratricopeptide repeat protein [Elusimicrobia bacterium]|nr:tetratricopeptide repeat protein [Elusimicrobiota bacterium]